MPACTSKYTSVCTPYCLVNPSTQPFRCASMQSVRLLDTPITACRRVCSLGLTARNWVPAFAGTTIQRFFRVSLARAVVVSQAVEVALEDDVHHRKKDLVGNLGSAAHPGDEHRGMDLQLFGERIDAADDAGRAEKRALMDAVAHGAGAYRIASCQRSTRSEEHTSELQSQSNLVCRLLL